MHSVSSPGAILRFPKPCYPFIVSLEHRNGSGSVQEHPLLSFCMGSMHMECNAWYWIVELFSNSPFRMIFRLSRRKRRLFGHSNLAFLRKKRCKTKRFEQNLVQSVLCFVLSYFPWTLASQPRKEDCSAIVKRGWSTICGTRPRSRTSETGSLRGFTLSADQIYTLEKCMLWRISSTSLPSRKRVGKTESIHTFVCHSDVSKDLAYLWMHNKETAKSSGTHMDANHIYTLVKLHAKSRILLYHLHLRLLSISQLPS